MNKRQKEIFGVLLIIISVISIVSLFGHNPTEIPSNLSSEFKINNPLGIYGVHISFYHFYLMGYPSIVIPLMFLIIGYVVFAGQKISKYKKELIYIFVCGLWISVLIGFIGGYNDLCPGCPDSSFNIYYNHAGILGLNIYIFLRHIFGFYGTSIFLLTSLLFILTGITKKSIYDLFKEIIHLVLSFLKILKNIFTFIIDKLRKVNIRKNKSKQDNEEISIDSSYVENSKPATTNVELKSSNTIQKNNIEEVDSKDYNKSEENNIIKGNDFKEENNEEIKIEEEQNIDQGDLDVEQKKKSKYFNYKLPKLDFLDDPIEVIKHNEDDLINKGKQLKYAINTFGVDGEVVKISPGPVISLFEIEPAEGVRVNKFVNLSDDLARVMKAQRVRIIAPIPGSRSVGIEIPNDQISIVYLKSILNSTKYIESKSKLTVALGKTTSGDAFIFDLCKMPHLLVAGATGSGKSVCINTIILSILYKSKPDEVKFILMDPKKIELSTYKSLEGYHLITAENLDEYVMTTPENAVGILTSAITEMERRFDVFSDARVRNIEEYHKKQKNDDSLEILPYIVVLIDELADLMMTSGRAVEEPITRLAQKARAVGIHLVVATQRPSVDVITGLIKSNFPSRISFLVSSKVDSRTILDQMGAEKLLGRGDMLFLLPGSSSPLRIHNAYVTLDEIEKVMDHIKLQPKPDEVHLPEIEKKLPELDKELKEGQDELLKDAAELVINHQQASVSLLQRKFRIGYSRAGRIIDELESMGIISGYSGSKAREVLVDYSYLKEVFDD